MDLTMKSILFVFLLIPSLVAALTPQEAQEVGVDVYIYGYPYIAMDMTRGVMTNVPSRQEGRAPMGQFYHERTFPQAGAKTPNPDLLTSNAWLDLSREPYVLHVPNERGRYYLMPMLSGWTEVFEDPGTRTTGNDAADFLISGPGWEGDIPEDVIHVRSPTKLVWISGKTASTGTDEDLDEVHAIQDQYTLVPLSYYGKPYTYRRRVVNYQIDMQTPVKSQINDLDIATFLKKLAFNIKNNPPAPDDRKIVAKMAKIGLIPGKDFDFNALSPEIQKALENVPKLAQEKIMAHLKEAGRVVNGWTVVTQTGRYENDYLQRALIAAVRLGATLSEDVVVASLEVDSQGNPLIGAKSYTLHFPKEKLPAVKEMWSLTLYNDQFEYAPNPLNRFTLGSKSPLKFNEDGSLDLYIQKNSPGTEKQANWLPAPEGRFILSLRLYWPNQAVINGGWNPPPLILNSQ